MLTNGKRSARIGNAVGTAGVAQLVEQLICNQQAGGSSPSTSSTSSSFYLGEFQSGQMGQTVNLLSTTSVVRIHLPPPAQKFPPPFRFRLCRKLHCGGNFFAFNRGPRCWVRGCVFLRGTPLRWRRGPGGAASFFLAGALGGMEGWLPSFSGRRGFGFARGYGMGGITRNLAVNLK